MKFSFIFAWYDIWVGAYFDRAKNWLYILPLPMVGIILKFPKRPPPPAIRRGDLVRINQPGFAFDGYIGTVIDEPTDDGFDLTDGHCIVVCLQGKVLKECRRRRAFFGLSPIKTTYTVLQHGNGI